MPTEWAKEVDRLRGELRKFKKEWADRFGFLAEKNPRDSFESIDEVAGILHREEEGSNAKG